MARASIFEREKVRAASCGEQTMGSLMLKEVLSTMRVLDAIETLLLDGGDDLAVLE